MKILFTSPLPLDHATGPSTPLSYIKDALVESNHDVTIIDRTHYKEFEYDIKDVGRATCFDLVASYDVEDCDVFIGCPGSCLLQMKKLPDAKKFTLWFSSHYNFASRVLEEEYKKFNINGPAIHPYEKFKAQKEQIMSDYIVVPSDHCAKTYIDNDIPKDKLRVVNFGVDTVKFQPVFPFYDKNKLTFLFAGGNWIRKGLPYLIEAWKHLKPDALLSLIGTDIGKVTESIVSHGWVPDEEVPSGYRNADVFVMPSLEEGSALVIFEAMASGLPCIVTPECGSLIEDSVDGIIIPSRNIKAIGEAIKYFVDNPEETRRMGIIARKKAEDHQWDRFKNDFIKLVEEEI